jgi:hypothetical protein
MSSIKPHQYDPDTWDDQEEPEAYQPLRKQTGKATTLKDARRQQGKEWGRSVHKYFKQRAKTGKP